MIRKSRALLLGSIAAWVVAIFAFVGGWASALTYGDAMDINTFVSSMLPGQSGPSATPKDLRSDFQTFWEVWGLVNREFYTKEPLEQKKMVYGAIRGMLQSLGDDYTVFQEPDVAAQSREHMRGTLEGIGTFLRVTDGEVVIDRPIKNSPAEKAGLLPGDVLVQVDGVDMAALIKGMKDGEAAAAAASKVRGDKGSIAKLVVRRPPATATFTLEIVRDAVPLISVTGQMLEGGVAYVQISEFKSNTNEELNGVLRELLPQNPSSIVLDLRNNPGGFLQSAQEVLGHFYSGVALYEIDADGALKEMKTIDAKDDTRAYELPMVVLINGNSASAAEIVAGALRDTRPNTRLLGDKSFGKGSVQNIHTLNDGSSARITFAHWLTPNKSEIHKIGITPQYQVPFSSDGSFAVPCVGEQRPAEGFASCTDAQLYWGTRLLTSNQTPPAAQPAPTPQPAG
jgi:carboxyl-terminal processing protease